MKKILFVSNYYYPYISGVTEFERIIAENLLKRGYEVKVITARHDNNLPKEEIIHGVSVKRCNVQLRISKGTISIPFIYEVIKQAKKYDIVNMQLPMLESGFLSLFIKREKLMPYYHCDMNLPDSMLNDLIIKVMDFSHKLCLKRSNKIWVSSVDYASHSRVAGRFSNKFAEVGLPIKEMQGVANHISKERKKIGFCGRIVEEKGIDVLIKAFEIVQKQMEDVELIIGGDYKNVAGGSVYPQLKKYIDTHKLQNITFLGKIPEEKMTEFYSSLDVFTLPSINSLEAFGMVQVEAMMCGTPVIASDLYGVRTVVEKTGMGKVCKRSNEQDLAACIIEVLKNRDQYVQPKEYIASIFSTQTALNKIEEVIG